MACLINTEDPENAKHDSCKSCLRTACVWHGLRLAVTQQRFRNITQTLADMA